MKAHRECLEHAAVLAVGVSDAQRKAGDMHAALATSAAALSLRLEASKAELTPKDITEERAAMGRFLRDRFGDMWRSLFNNAAAVRSIDRATLEAFGKEIAVHLGKQVENGEHAYVIEEMRLKKKETR